MLLGDPPATPLDFQFEIFRIPVRVSGLFWILPVIFGIQYGHPLYIIVWGLAIFSGILVHELGHALAFRRYGVSPRIALTMMGGYATENQFDVWNLSGGGFGRHRTPQQQIAISAAGPAAGFLLAAVVIGLVFLLGGWIDFQLAYGFLPYWWVELQAGEPYFFQYPRLIDYPSNTDLLYVLVDAFLFVNIYWGILNLMPVYPLDGGNIAREVMVMNDPRQGYRNSLWLSVFVGALIAFAGIFVLQRTFMGIMFGIFAFQSYQMIQQLDGKGFGRGPW